MKLKKHYGRKLIALILTMLAFTSTASFSGTATATVIGSDVIIVNDDGRKIAVPRSEIISTEAPEESLDKEAVEIQDEELDRIAEDSRKAAEDFNKRMEDSDDENGASSDTLVEDENGDLISPQFDQDWSLILVNKDHLIPDDYTFELASITDEVKSDVRCAGALADMIKAARDDGVYLYVASPYRDLKRQTYVFDKKVAELEAEGYDHEKASELAAETVAPPGTSEHQIGLAFDFVCDRHWKLDEAFAYTAGGRWLAEHGPEHGFILRYPRGKEDITMIEFEPWHYRYVGVDAAMEMKRLGLTLEEYDQMIGLVE